MVQVYLTSEEFVKSLCSIDENIANKYLGPAIVEAQEIELREILGDSLLDTLKGMIAENNIPEQYKELINRIQYVLAYKAIVSLCVLASYKIANAGVVTTGDDNVRNLDWKELTSVREYYTHKSDAYAGQLQRYILQNKDQFPELKDCECKKIKAHLLSAASCGLWLGGVRARKLVPCKRY